MPRYDNDDYEDIRLRDVRARERGPRPQSGLGMVSLVIAIVMVVAMLGLIGVAVVVTEKNGGQMNDNDPVAITLGLGIIGCLLITVIGLVLGLVGAFQSDRNPTLAIVGTVLNGVILLGVVSLMCLGVFMG